MYTAFQLEEFFNGQNILLFAEYVAYAPAKLEMARNGHNQARYKHQLGVLLWLFITVAQIIDPCMVQVGMPYTHPRPTQVRISIGFIRPWDCVEGGGGGGDGGSGNAMLAVVLAVLSGLFTVFNVVFFTGFGFLYVVLLLCNTYGAG